MGFAFGEGGELVLVRIRGGREVDILDLTPFFKGADVNAGDIAVLQRWEPDYKNDLGELSRPDFPAQVAKRPVVKIMDFVDYDHDGRPSEFYLKTDTEPCGKSVGVVIGISRRNQRLHAFGTVSNPTKALVLQKRVWEAVGKSAGFAEIVNWACDDHGADQEEVVRLRSTIAGVEGTRMMFGCPRTPGQRPISQAKF